MRRWPCYYGASDQLKSTIGSRYDVIVVVGEEREQAQARTKPSTHAQ